MLRTLTFTETVGGATYTATTSVPKGARILDVLVETISAWTAATVPVDVGDSDAVDSLVAAADLAAVVFVNAGGGSLGGTAWGDSSGNGAAYSDAAGGTGKLYPNGDTITAVCTPTVPGGPTGISRVTLWIELPALARAAIVV